MSSIETFSNNVKRYLAQRNIRIKDLAARIGLSESYLSLVLNGTRKNLNDEYKDRIASVLNVPLSVLYAESVPVRDEDDSPSVFADASRHELKDLVEVFLTKANLRHRRTPFYLVLGTLNDRDAQSVKYFLSEVLKEFTRQDQGARPEDLTDLTEEQMILLALCSIAGDNSKHEWVRAISDLADEDFGRVIQSLQSRGLLSIVEDTGCKRIRLSTVFMPVSSLFSEAKLRDIHRNLAAAMRLYPDDDAYFYRELGEVLVKALQDKEAVTYLEKAAMEFSLQGLHEEAASSWHEAAVIHGLLGKPDEKGRCLCEAARCAAAAGNYETAAELAERASSTFMAAGLTKIHAKSCNLFGAIFTPYNLEIAASWYKKGLQIASQDSALYGPLLINLATINLQRGKVGEAENALGEVSRWAEGRTSPDTRRVLSHRSLLLGLIEFEKRNWKKAREHFLFCIETGEGIPEETIATAWHNLGMIMYRMDDMSEARKCLMVAQDINKAKNLMPRWASGLIELAKVALREGNPKEARELIDQAVPHLDEQALRERGWMWLINGCIHRMGGHLSEAVEAGRKAIDHFQREGAQRDLACAALWLSQVFREMGLEQEEHVTQKRAFQIYEKGRWDMRELHRECSLLSPSRPSAFKGVEEE